MSPFVLQPLFYAMYKWPNEAAGITREQKISLRAKVHQAYLFEMVLVFVLVLAKTQLKQLPFNWGYDRPLAFLIGQFTFDFLLHLPLFFISTSAEKQTDRFFF